MPVAKLKQFLDEHHIKYVSMLHSRAYTAQEIAASTHIPGKELAKTVMLKSDGKMVMAVCPANCRIDMDKFREISGAKNVELAAEAEFENLFPNCEVGAMPPFGNLWDIPVYVCESLIKNPEIAFNAGSHSEVIKMSFDDFRRLVQPKIAWFSKPQQ